MVVMMYGDVRFNMINPATGNRIKMVTTDPDTGPVERRDLVKGYEVDKGQYILVTEEEIRSVRLESTKRRCQPKLIRAGFALLLREFPGSGKHSLRNYRRRTGRQEA